MIDSDSEFKSLIETVKKIAEADHAQDLLSLLARSEITIRQTGYDNWNGGIYFYTVFLAVEVSKFIEVRNDLDHWEKILLEHFQLPVRHLESEEISRVALVPKSAIAVTPEANPGRPLSSAETKRKELLTHYLDKVSEDELIELILMPLFRHLGFQRVTVTGHKDKQLEFGKDVWMKFVLPTQHLLYFGIQVKKGKIDSAGITKTGNNSVAEVYNQSLMLLGLAIFDPDIGKNVLVDHVIILAGGEITKAARLWLGSQLDAVQRRQIIFMDREDILNLYIVNNIPLPAGAFPPAEPEGDDLPF
ncbi:hypothetical protein [Mucilaginibacter psychrotolerans]|uniref:Restriction endonuclease n=1 Tax=Mucilaginibacter psychrotolerans TaxID=1524096 RepID=A0A4Y8SGD2_9SPHI|nr:hypothetical protein [Mucilaginibacter psychrotolerans]TFF37700.1 hypothetical protein E2R66_11065 [Mucilaginibacter psychrotolerans]